MAERGEVCDERTVLITGDERRDLRDRGMVRWLQSNADGLARLEEATALARQNREVLATIRADLLTRTLDREHRAIQRQLREVERRELIANQRRMTLPRVLVADERPIERVLLMHLLRADGRVEVVADAVDGAEAVGLAIVEQPDVAVLDMGLPTLDAHKAAQRIRRYAPFTRCVLLVDDPAGRPGEGVDAVHDRSADRLSLVSLVVRLAA